MGLSFGYLPAQAFTSPGSSRTAPVIFISLPVQSVLVRTSIIVKSGLPSIALSSSFVIFGASSDIADVDQTAATEIKTNTMISFLFTIRLSFLQNQKMYQPPALKPSGYCSNIILTNYGFISEWGEPPIFLKEILYLGDLSQVFIYAWGGHHS
jgi:hypothetical protein